jgi:hypothetical protein
MFKPQLRRLTKCVIRVILVMILGDKLANNHYGVSHSSNQNPKNTMRIPSLIQSRRLFGALEGTAKNYAAWSDVLAKWQQEAKSESAAMSLAAMALKLDGLIGQQPLGATANLPPEQ